MPKSRDETAWFDAGPGGRFPWWLGVVGGLFLLLAAGLVATSMADRSPPTWAPTPPEAGPTSDGDGTFRVTLDARDPARWVYFRFSDGRISRRTFEGWDLAARRFRVVVNGGEGLPGDARAALAGSASLDSVEAPPATGWRATERDGEELSHPLLGEWYAYDFFAHLLRPRSRAYVVRTTGGGHVALRFLGYYCPGTRAGCVTFRFRPLDRPAVGGPATSEAST